MTPIVLRVHFVAPDSETAAKCPLEAEHNRQRACVHADVRPGVSVHVPAVRPLPRGGPSTGKA